MDGWMDGGTEEGSGMGISWLYTRRRIVMYLCNGASSSIILVDEG